MLCVTKRVKAFIEQSGIVFGSDQHQLTVDNTVNNGGIIAHVESNANGEAINKTLNFTTKTIKTTVIQDHATSEQRSLGVNVGINNAKDKGASKNEQSLGASSINASHSGHDYQATTQATIGEGAVVTSDANALANVNRDVNTATVITKNQDIGGLNANVTVDSRLFTEAGRAQIKAEQAEVGVNIQKVGDITGEALDKAGTLVREILPDVLPDKVAKQIVSTVGGLSSKLSLPSHDNNGGIYSQIPQFLGSISIHGGTVQSRDINDPYVLAHPDEFVKGDTLDGFKELEGPGRAILDKRVVSNENFVLNTENSGRLFGTNGMLNALSNAVINIMEQTTNISVEYPQTLEPVTVNIQSSHGPLADVLEAMVQKGNIAFNQFVLSPVSSATNAVVGSNINLNVAIDGDSKQAVNFYTAMQQTTQGKANVLIASHSQGNEETAIALQVMGANSLNHNYYLSTYGSPVNNTLMESIVNKSGGQLVAIGCNAGDLICMGLGSNNVSRYNSVALQTDPKAFSSTINVQYVPILSDLIPTTLFSNIAVAGKLFDTKYPVYNVNGLNEKNEPITKQSYFKPEAVTEPQHQEPTKDVSPHSGYPCLAGNLCGNAFGEAVEQKYLDEDIKRANEKNKP